MQALKKQSKNSFKLNVFQLFKSKSESEVAQSCLTLCDPIDCNLPGSSVHGIFQVIVLEWIAIAFSEKEVQYSQSLEGKEGMMINFMCQLGGCFLM